ncbi:hypothetical protein QZM97_26190 [Burkholderia orbicola]|uniref:hypothetical protein n=1 Tax=Burkholderia orbicola TaxID=2978683 RepID=UPI0026522156|nr:hypothetical protein [Burkholderia orbicola]MDN7993573.1 hypothetical protein [Burkholderia orbicola]
MGSIITAGTTRTQAGATVIDEDFTTVNTSTAVTAGTNSGDGVALPKLASGSWRGFLLNNTANAIRLYGNGTDTINGNVATNGIAIPAGAAATVIEVAPGSAQVILDGEPTVSFNSNTATSGTTLTAANVTGGSACVDLALTGTLGAGANAQLPTVANLVASMWSVKVGATYRLRIINESSGAFAWTVTTNTGWTLAGTMSIAQNTWREFVVTVTALGASPAATLQSVAVGTFS